ncbi:MAG: efflux RND transporter permease subunit, partial [Bdellovibrionaceae bacterium]|nr:efflux RND transporter permease subunit [Pseudobdellovibrionaceae bacterium]
MQIWELSVRRPVFMSCVLVVLLVLGFFSFKKTPIELFPDVSFPVVVVQTIYPGAGPNEIESLISKPLEEEISTLAGIKNIRSVSRESVSVVVAEFNLSVDIKYAEQQVREKVSSARRRLPEGIEEPVIRRVDPSAQPIMVIVFQSELPEGKLYDLTNDFIRPQLEQVDQVGRVDIVGLRKREIQVLLDRNLLKQREISVTQVASSLSQQGQNIPAGKFDGAGKEKVFRTLGEFSSLEQIMNSLVFFYGNDVGTKVKDVGRVFDTLEDEKMKAWYNGKPAAFINVYKQSGANTLAVSQALKKKIGKINQEIKGKGELFVTRDTSKFVWANVLDVVESILIGVILTVLVVYLFLGSWRSTFITGFAIPVSLIGSFSFLYLTGVTINIMSLLAFSLAVGLLIDDAIVVRENIFRHLEMGKSPIQAALDGTREVGLAVIAVTLAILAVFGPIAFLSGVVGQFFKSFGLGVCFVMIVSLFDALSNAPMLSAYFGGRHDSTEKFSPSFRVPVRSIVYLFDRFQSWLENKYEKILIWVVYRPLSTITFTLILVFILAGTVVFVPKTFIPANDSGEFQVSIELQPGSVLSEMNRVATEIDAAIRFNPNVASTTVAVGDVNGKSHVADIYVQLKPFGERDKKTSQVKAEIRELLQSKFSYAQPKVKDIDFVGAGQRLSLIHI